MKKKVMKESTAWQIGAHTVMIIGSLLAILPFILLVIASFTDNQTALVNGYSFTPEKCISPANGRPSEERTL